MIYVLALLLSYGLCFGAMNKVGVLLPAMHPQGVVSPGRKLLNTLFTCPYCMGFHTGWMSWLLISYVTRTSLLYDGPDLLRSVAAILSWSLISAAFCYIADVFTVYLEESR